MIPGSATDLGCSSAAHPPSSKDCLLSAVRSCGAALYKCRGCPESWLPVQLKGCHCLTLKGTVLYGTASPVRLLWARRKLLKIRISRQVFLPLFTSTSGLLLAAIAGALPCLTVAVPNKPLLERRGSMLSSERWFSCTFTLWVYKRPNCFCWGKCKILSTCTKRKQN